MDYSKSNRLFSLAKKVIPGGVNSPVRAFKSVGADPLFISKASGSRIFDVDGNEFIDYVGSWGPMILGHCHPDVVAAVKSAADSGASFGAPTEKEITLAEMVIDAVPSIEMVRMVSSGTEATMSAIRLARGYTGRDKILKFSGCYHGHSDALLVKAGSGAATFGVPDSPGVPNDFAKNTLTANFNSIASVKALLAENKNQIACIIVEPIAGNMGTVPPQPGFLEGLRQLCTDEGIGGLRRNPRHDNSWQDHRRRSPGGSIRRQKRDYGDAISIRRRLSGRHTIRQPAGNERRNRNSESS